LWSKREGETPSLFFSHDIIGNQIKDHGVSASKKMREPNPCFWHHYMIYCIKERGAKMEIKLSKQAVKELDKIDKDTAKRIL
jgi:hypothetical protein